MGGGRRWTPSPVSLALLGVSVALVGNLATNLIQVNQVWWRPAVFTTLGLLIVGVVVLEIARQRAEQIQEQLGLAGARPRAFGALPRQAWQWQPRPQEEAAVRAALGRRGRAALVALPGARGAGKSQLAAGYAHACLEQGYDLVAWINTESGPVAELAGLAAHLGLPGVAEMAPEQAAAAVCRWLEFDGPARRLLVFDNVDDPGALRGYVPAAGSTKVLITTNRREFTTMAGIAVVEVGMFTPAEGEEFLTRATGLDSTRDGNLLGELLGWLPLGLAQAAALIVRTKMSYAEYAQQVQCQDLDETLRQQAGADHPGVLKATRLSLARLGDADPSGDAARLLRVLSLLSSDGVSWDLLVQAERQLGLHGAVWPVISILVDASLVTLGGGAPGASEREARRVVGAHRLTTLVVRYEAGRPPGDDLAAALDTATRLLNALIDHFPLEKVAMRRDELDEFAAHLDAVRSRTGDPSPLLLTQADRVAELLVQASDPTRAVLLFEGAVADRERLFGAEHPDTLTSQNNLASAYQSAGQLDEAVTLYELTLVDRERLLGAEHPDTLAAQNNLANAYRSAGRLGDAITLHERTFAAYERLLGAEHPDTLASQNNLANAYQSAGRIGEAVALFERTLEDRERLLGAEHPDTLISGNDPANAYRSAGRLDEAVALHEQTLADRARLLGTEHPDTLTSGNNLAYTYQSSRAWDVAITLYLQTIRNRTLVLGVEHPDTLDSKSNLAGAFQLAGHLDEAVDLYERTLADCERVLGPAHPSTESVRSNLADAQRELSERRWRRTTFSATRSTPTGTAHDSYRYRSGEQSIMIVLYGQTLANCERVLGPAHPTTESVRRRLVAARREWQRLTALRASVLSR